MATLKIGQRRRRRHLDFAGGIAYGEGVSGKQALRERVWKQLERRRVARFPLPVAGRIPNFRGAEAAAARAATLPEWTRARRLKCNPDAPQRALRLRALREGKLVFMAVPRLTAQRCFLRLDPVRLGGRLREAATIGGAARLGEAVGPEALGRIDLVVAGSVAVNRRGARVGKGGGYSDLEFALARAVGAVDERTPVLTTVHGLQVLSADIPMTPHDVPIDLIVTPERVIRTRPAFPRPSGIRWAELSPAQLAAMPVLQPLRPARVPLRPERSPEAARPPARRAARAAKTPVRVIGPGRAPRRTPG
jgi:5-formyltetrahydrofolate cyclo-ligase